MQKSPKLSCHVSIVIDLAVQPSPPYLTWVHSSNIIKYLQFSRIIFLNMNTILKLGIIGYFLRQELCIYQDGVWDEWRLSSQSDSSHVTYVMYITGRRPKRSLAGVYTKLLSRYLSKDEKRYMLPLQALYILFYLLTVYSDYYSISSVWGIFF